MNNIIQNKEITLETIRNNKDILIAGRTSYFADLVKTAVQLTTDIKNETNQEIIDVKSMLITETITVMTASWRNTLPFNLFVSKGAADFAKNLGVADLRNYNYSLKFGMDEIVEKIEDPAFLSVAENLNDQDVAKLNKALSKDDKTVNSNVMIHWEHAYTGKMFTTDVTDLIKTLSEDAADNATIFEAVKDLVEKQAIVWVLKPESYVLTEKGFKDTRLPDWESIYKECGIELSETSKADYKNSFGKEW
ncbi:hypothetical protein [Vagococcus hydrophili]|uniref:Uncharacterized protein n=1 Tax=Vagococcus hydrophili TaxID=2714947 RepID=A0A6G8AWD1_9ENTE|nr:hypothetical protein [Vagococcus hydrophili]QIL49203.1 hypothetical protein G7082_12235 [Vagococcus hydrophili]